MPKKGSRTEDILEAPNDEKISNTLIAKLQDKIINEFNAKLELKFAELISEMNANIKSSVTQITTEIISEALIPTKNQIKNLDNRINLLEQRAYQNYMLIFGFIDKQKVTDDPGSNQQHSTQSSQLVDLLIDHFNQDLNIQINHRDINFAFWMKKKNPNQSQSPILISFTSSHIKSQIQQKN